MHVLKDPAELIRLLKSNAAEEPPPLDQAAEWLANPDHFALVEGNDLGLCMGALPGPVHVHVFYQSRGKEAFDLARRMLQYVFDAGATEILGETPAKFPNAVRFAQLLGFELYGEKDTPSGKVVLSRLQIDNCVSPKKAA